MLPDRYRMEGGIAAGGMAAVYAAHDTLLNRPVAVKVLADHLNGDVVARRRFAREARAAAGLSNHPGVVTIFDVGEHDGRAFMVMERRTGGTIADAGPVSHARALGWLHTIADALDTAHAQGVVHRDIKPGNLLLDDQDRVAVADFGIASVAHETEKFTQTGQVLGTASYLSPEQAVGEPATPASDLYALAVVAYELLSGQKPFAAGHFTAQARAHIEEPPPPAPGLPPAAQQVLARGLAKDPAARWPSATAFVDALDRALADRPAPAETEVTRPMVAQAPARPAAPRPPAPPRRDRRSPVAALAVAALLAVGVIAAVLASSGGNDDPSGAKTQTAAATKKKHKRKNTATAAPTASPSPEPTATASPSPAPTPATTTTDDAAGGDPSALNTQGFAAIKQGDYAGAIDPLQQAVAACDGGGRLDPCGFAYYNLATALIRTGRGKEAKPLLQTRLKVWGDNANGDVKRALKEAK